MSKKFLVPLVVSMLSATALVGVSQSAQACTINGRPCREVVEGVPIQILPGAGTYKEPQSEEPRSRERRESPDGENPENYRQRKYEQSEPYPTDGSNQPVFVFTDEKPHTVNPERDNPTTLQSRPGRVMDCTVSNGCDFKGSERGIGDD